MAKMMACVSPQILSSHAKFLPFLAKLTVPMMAGLRRQSRHVGDAKHVPQTLLGGAQRRREGGIRRRCRVARARSPAREATGRLIAE